MPSSDLENFIVASSEFFPMYLWRTRRSASTHPRELNAFSCVPENSPTHAPRSDGLPSGKRNVRSTPPSVTASAESS